MTLQYQDIYETDINFSFFLLRRQTSKVYNWLQKFTIQHPVALL